MVKDSNMNTIDDTIADLKQVWYLSAKEWITVPISHLGLEAFIDGVQQGLSDILLMINVDKLAKSHFCWIPLESQL